MKPFIVVGMLLSALVFTPLGTAQEELQPPPADWGELARLLVENWGLEVCGEPTGGASLHQRPEPDRHRPELL